MHRCAECGMVLLTPGEYHPHTACVLFTALWDGDAVRGLLREITMYGARAARVGLPVDDALAELFV